MKMCIIKMKGLTASQNYLANICDDLEMCAQNAKKYCCNVM